MFGRDVAIAARTWSAYRQQDRIGLPHRVSDVVDVDLAEAGLVLIDVWDDEAPVPQWPGSIPDRCAAIRNLVPLVSRFRELTIPIFHDHTALPIHSDLLHGWTKNDFQVEWDDQGGGTVALNCLLQEFGVRTLFWAGFATNLCLLSKPCGFRNVLATDWSRRHIVLRDCTSGVESDSTQETRALWDAAIYEFEYQPLGWSTTSTEVLEALAGQSQSGPSTQPEIPRGQESGLFLTSDPS